MQDGEPGVGGVGDDPVGQDVPVAESNPGYLDGSNNELFRLTVLMNRHRLQTYVRTFVPLM